MALKLKIYYADSKEYKILRFTQDMSVSECLKKIREKSEDSGRDHGLYLPPVYDEEDPGAATLSSTGQNRAVGRWLLPDKTLFFYDLTNDSQLQYLKKHRPVKFRLLDDTVKQVVVDCSAPVQEVVVSVAEKLSLPNAEEYSLQAEGKAGWLHPKKAISESGINMIVDESGRETYPPLALRKKFFYSDDTVVKEDAVQLHLLYVQLRSSVVAGEMYTAGEEAIQLAALQAQIQMQNYNPSIHREKTLDTHQYLPPSMVAKKRDQAKNEKLIFQEWEKLSGMSEIDAKYRYVQLARSLKTFGMTIFNIQQDVDKGKKIKREPKLFAVTRDSLIAMDTALTEERKWPLTHLKSWNGVKGKFTLDFGKHDDSRYTFYTSEAELIAQMIAGYIDIILKRRATPELKSEEGDDDIAVIEDIGPIMAVAAKTTRATITAREMGAKSGELSQMAPGMQGYSSGGPEGRSGYPDLDSALKAARTMIGELNAPLGSAPAASRPPEDYKNSLAAAAKAVGEAVSKLVGEAAKKVPDKGKMTNIANDLLGDIRNLVDAARAAAAADPDNINLLEAAKLVSDAVARVLQCSKLVADNPNDPKAREALRQAQDQLRHAQNFMNAALKGVLADEASRNLLMQAAKALAGATSGLVAASSAAVKEIGDPAKQRAAASDIKGLADASQKMLSTAIALAPAIGSSGVKKQVATTAVELKNAASSLLGQVKAGNLSPATQAKVEKANDSVAKALATMMDAIKAGTVETDNGHELNSAAADIKRHTGLVKQYSANPATVGGAMRKIVPAANKLISATKSVAVGVPDEMKNRMLDAAKQVAAATAALVNASNASKANPKNATNQKNLRDAAARLEKATDEVVTKAGRKAALLDLQYQAKNAAAAATGLASSSKAAVGALPDRTKQVNLLKAASTGNKAARALLDSSLASANNPDSKEKTDDLLRAIKAFEPPATTLGSIASASAITMTTHPSKKRHLLEDSVALKKAMKALQTSVAGYSSMDEAPEIKSAMEKFQAIDADLEVAQMSVESGSLKPSPGATPEAALKKLDSTTHELKKCNAALEKIAAENPDKIGAIGDKLAEAMSSVFNAATDVAALQPAKFNQRKIIDSVQALVGQEQAALLAGRALSVDTKDAGKAKKLRRELVTSNAMIEDLRNAARGVDAGDIDSALDAIAEAKAKLGKEHADPSVGHAEAVTELNAASKAMQAALSQLASAAQTSPKDVGNAAKMVASTMPALVSAINNAAASAPNAQVGDAVIQQGKQTIDGATRVLQLARMAATKNDPKAVHDLIKAAKIVSDALGKLLELSSPGLKEANESLSAIIAALKDLDSSSSSSIDGAKALTILNKAVDKLEASSMDVIKAAKRQPEKIGEHSKAMAKHVGYLVGATKAIASSSKDDLPNQKAMEASARTILSQAEKAKAEPANKAVAINAAKTVAKETTTLCENLKRAATATTDANKKSAMIKNAQGIAGATGGLAKAVKALASNVPNAANDVQKASAALEAVAGRVLRDLSAPTGPKEAKLVDATRATASASSNLINASLALSQNAGNREFETALNNSGKSISDSIKHLKRAVANLTPGVVECGRALDAIQAAQDSLESASISAEVGTLENTTRPGKTFQDCQQELVNLSRSLARAVSNVVTGVRNSGPELATGANEIKKGIPIFIDATLGAAATAANKDAVTDLLNTAKALTDAMAGLVDAAGKAAADPAAKETVMKSSKEASDVIGKIVSSLKDTVVSIRDVDEAVTAVNEAANLLEQPLPRADKQYKESKKEITLGARVLGKHINNMVRHAKTNNAEVGSSAKGVGESLTRVVNAARSGAAATKDEKARSALLNAVKQLVGQSKVLVSASRVVVADPKNTEAHRQLMIKPFTLAMGAVIKAAEQAATGEVEINKALNALQKIVADLDSQSLLAAAGEFDIDVPAGTTFEKADEELQKCANALQIASGKVQAAAKSSEDDLGQVSRQIAIAIVGLSKKARIVASFIPNNDSAQQQLLAVAKTAASSAYELIDAAKHSQDDSNKARELPTLTAHVNDAVKNILNVSKTAVADSIKGMLALDEAKKSISNIISSFNTSFPAKSGATAESLVVSCRDVAGALGDLGNSTSASNQDELVKATKDLSHTLQVMLANVKGTLSLTSDASIQKPVATTGLATAKEVITLLEAVQAQIKDPKSAKNVSTGMQNVASKIQSVVAAAQKLPGGSGLTLDEDTGPDPLDEKAEKELNKAAEIIADSTKKLEASKPATKEGKFDIKQVKAIIISGTVALSKATVLLVKAASASQAERIARSLNPATKHFYRKDPIWTDALIKAGHAVASNAQGLQKIAGSTLEDGSLDEKPLVDSARALATSSSNLVAHCRAKSSAGSKTAANLTEASKAVGKATTALAESAKQAIKALKDAEEAAKMETELKEAERAGDADFEKLVEIAKLEEELARKRRALRKRG